MITLKEINNVRRKIKRAEAARNLKLLREIRAGAG